MEQMDILKTRLKASKQLICANTTVLNEVLLLAFQKILLLDMGQSGNFNLKWHSIYEYKWI